MHRTGTVALVALLALALLPPLVAQAAWRSSATVPLQVTIGPDAVDLGTPDGGTLLHSVAQGLPRITDAAMAKTLYGEVSGPSPVLHSTGTRPLTYWVGGVTATVSGSALPGITVAATVIPAGGTCDASGFGGGSPLLASSAGPAVATPFVATSPGGAATARTLDPGAASDRICTKLVIADASKVWGTAVTITWKFLARNAAGVAIPDPGDGTVPQVTWTRSFSAYVPPPVARSGSSVPMCDVTTTLGLFTAVTLNWAWPESSGFGANQGSNPDSFVIEARYQGILGAQGTLNVNSAARSVKITQSDLVKMLLNVVSNLLGATVELRLFAVVNGTRSDPLIANLTFGLLSLSATCTGPTQ